MTDAAPFTPAANVGPAAPIGVCLRPEYDEYALGRLAGYAQRAEAGGFDSVWLAESWGMDALTLLGHLGAHTRRIGLGTAIVNVYSRTPALLSMAALTLNELYGGRFVLGLGTSTKALVEDWHGMAFDRPVTRLRETVEIVRRLTRGDSVRYAGQTVSVSGYRLRVKPRHAPPPIYLAALGERSLRTVAEVADGWIPYLLPLRGLRSSVDALREGARAAGRDASAVRIVPLVLTAVSADRDAARKAARDHLAFYLGAMGPHYRGFVAGFGFEREVEAIREAWAGKRHDEARLAVTDTMIDEMAVAGTPPQCHRQLARVRAAGADLPVLFFPGTCTNAMVELALETMATPPAVLEERP